MVYLPSFTYHKNCYNSHHPSIPKRDLQAGDAISDEEAIEAARQAQILETLTALPERLDPFLGTGGAPGNPRVGDGDGWLGIPPGSGGKT